MTRLSNVIDTFLDTLQETEEEAQLRADIEAIRNRQLEQIDFGKLSVGSLEAEIRAMENEAQTKGLRLNLGTRLLSAIKTTLQGEKI